MKYTKIDRRTFLKAAGLTAVAVSASGLLAGCGSASSSTSDYEYIQGKGKLVIGMTIFNPMNYYDENGKLIGFDTELAEAVCAKLNLTPEFQEIEWDNKITELSSKNIDCIWNGMTVTEELGKSIDFSTPYSGNMQVCVISKANAGTYTSIDSINAAGVTVGAEAGSAGESAVEENFPNAELISMTSQRDCLLELKSGTIDVGVMDFVMADAELQDGTSYTDLQIVDGIELSKEEYAVGLRKGSDFTEVLNKTLDELVADGTVAALAEKYPSVMVTLG